MGKAKITVLEGEWWSKHEVPLILPFPRALDKSSRN